MGGGVHFLCHHGACDTLRLFLSPGQTTGHETPQEPSCGAAGTLSVAGSCFKDVGGGSLLAESPGAPHAAPGERASFLGRCFNTQPVAFSTPCRHRPQTFLPASLFLLHPLNLGSEVPSQRAAHLTEWPALACPGSPSALPLLPRRWAAGACAPPAARLPPAGDTSPIGCAPGNPARPLTPGSGAHCLPPGKKVFSFRNSTEQSRKLLKLKLFPSGHPAVRVTVLLFETQ